MMTTRNDSYITEEANIGILEVMAAGLAENKNTNELITGM